MPSLEILMLGLALATDAAVTTFAIGLMHAELPARSKFLRGFAVCGLFGFFQFQMLWTGSYAGYLFAFSEYGYLIQIGIALIFFVLAAKLIQDSLSHKEIKINWKLFPILILAIITSLDALISGVSLGTIPLAHFAAMEVGVITFILCGLFYFFSLYFKKIPRSLLLRLASMIFISLGLHIFWGLRHLFMKGTL